MQDLQTLNALNEKAAQTSLNAEKRAVSAVNFVTDVDGDSRQIVKAAIRKLFKLGYLRPGRECYR